MSERITALDHVVLTVTDIEATCGFYERALGLRRVTYGSDRTALAFGCQKLNLHAGDRPHPPVARRPAAGSADLCFLAPGGLAPVLGRLRDASVPLVDGPVVRTGAAGSLASVYVRDPDGNLVEVGAPQDRAGDVLLRPARPDDRAAVEALLRTAALPLDGLDDAWSRMRIACDGTRQLGAAGMEVWGDVGLLRSVVVHPDARGRGLGEELMWRVVAEGAAAGLREVWLLTFIPEWFERRGFTRSSRDTAPAALQASAEFRGACPDTAVAMVRSSRPEHSPVELIEADATYPIGPLHVGGGIDAARRRELIARIDAAPGRLRDAVADLDDDALDSPYRAGGWTVRQVVHHLADAHANGYQRLRLALTEPTPAIRGYDQTAWGELEDAKRAPIAWSLDAFEGLNRRMVMLLESLGPADLARRWVHPERGELTVDDWLGIYAWHVEHHTAQILAMRARRGW